MYVVSECPYVRHDSCIRQWLSLCATCLMRTCDICMYVVSDCPICMYVVSDCPRGCPQHQVLSGTLRYSQVLPNRTKNERAKIGLWHIDFALKTVCTRVCVCVCARARARTSVHSIVSTCYSDLVCHTILIIASIHMHQYIIFRAPGRYFRNVYM